MGQRKKYAVFTMDVETFSDTDCINYANIHVDADLLDGFDEYIKIMDRHGIKSTLFTLGKLAPKIVDRLKPCIARGHKLALHGYSHVPPMSIPVEQFREKTLLAKNRMESLFHTDVVGFRAPCFSMDKARLDVLQELGFQYDSSYLNYLKARHTVDIDLSDFQQLRNSMFRKKHFYEFGLSKGKVFGNPFPISGGGYVRLSQWGFIKALIHQYIRKNDYYVFYLHPFELTKQKVPFIKELKSYDKYYIKRGIRSYGKRVEKIIRMLKRQNYEFVTFEELVNIMEGKNEALPAAGD